MRNVFYCEVVQDNFYNKYENKTYILVRDFYYALRTTYISQSRIARF